MRMLYSISEFFINILRLMQWVSIFLLSVVILETVFCTIRAMQFRVEELSGYRFRFSLFYDIVVERNSVSWEESKNNWLLWLSVRTANIKTKYSKFMPFQGKSQLGESGDFITTNLRIFFSNIVLALANIGFYTLMFLLVPVYFLFSLSSFFERVCRLVLTPMVYSIFWILAKLKILYIYHFKGSVKRVDSSDEDVECDIGIIYRKPVIQIVLHNTQDCPDSAQKDNINHFTTTLKKHLPARQHVSFKTEVLYAGDVEALEKTLPLTINYLRANYAKLTHKNSKEVTL